MATEKAAAPPPFVAGETNARASRHPQPSPAAASPHPGSTDQRPLGADGATQRVRLLRDQDDHHAGDTLTVSAAEARSLIDAGAAEAI